MLELILKWEPEWKPLPVNDGGSYGQIQCKLRDMGLWNTFWEQEESREPNRSCFEEK